jgi:hypothetical protein
MSSNKKSSTKKSLKLKKGGAFEYAKMFQSSLSPCDKKNMNVANNSQNGGSSCAANDDSYNSNYSTYYQNNPDTSIRLYNDYSKDWHYPGMPESQIPYAIDSSAGINEYQFGRTTPDNKFIVATGLVKNNVGIEMTGGKKKKPKSKSSSAKKSKPSTSKKVVKKVKSSVKKVVKSVGSSVKKIVKKVKKSTTSKKSKPKSTKKTKTVKKSKPKSTKKSKSMLNKTKNAIKSVGKKVSSLFSKK